MEKAGSAKQGAGREKQHNVKFAMKEKAPEKFDRKAMLAVVGVDAGKLKGKTTAQWLDEMRGPVELPRRKK